MNTRRNEFTYARQGGREPLLCVSTTTASSQIDHRQLPHFTLFAYLPYDSMQAKSAPCVDPSGLMADSDRMLIHLCWVYMLSITTTRFNSVVKIICEKWDFTTETPAYLWLRRNDSLFSHDPRIAKMAERRGFLDQYEAPSWMLSIGGQPYFSPCRNIPL